MCCMLAQETEFARVWDVGSTKRMEPLRAAAAREWGCPESDVFAHQLQYAASLFSIYHPP